MLSNFFLALIFLTSGLLMAIQAKIGPNYLRFSPAAIVIDPIKLNSGFGVALLKKPKGTVHVFYAAESLRFDKCTLKFDASNWDKLQQLTVTPIPFLINTGEDRVQHINFTAYSCDETALNNRVQLLTTRRKPGADVLCHSVGDPHYQSFSEVEFDFMGHGKFNLVKSPFLRIQYLSLPLYSMTVTNNKAIAVQYGSCGYILIAEETGIKGFCNQSGVIVAEVLQKNETHFNFPDGANILAKRRTESRKMNLSLHISLPGHAAGQVSGICGPFKIPMDKTFYTAGGAVAYTPSQMALSFKVKPEDDLFSCIEGRNCTKLEDAPSALLCVVPGFVECVVKGNITKPSKLPKNAKIIAPQPPDNITLPVTPANVKQSTKKVTPAFKREAKKLCDKVLNVPALKKIASPKYYLDSCIGDVCLTGDLAYAELYKQVYVEQVTNLIDSAREDPLFNTTRKRKDLDKAAEALGLSGQKCPLNCGGNGKCMDTGCLCNDSWTGLACNISMSSYKIEGPTFTDEDVQLEQNFTALPEDEIKKALPAENTTQEEVQKALSTENTKQEEVQKAPSTENTKQDEVQKASSPENTKQDEVQKTPSTGNTKQDEVQKASSAGNTKQDEAQKAPSTGNTKQDEVTATEAKQAQVNKEISASCSCQT